MERVALPTKFSKSESSVGFQFFEDVATKKGVTFSGKGGGRVHFLHKKLKSEIFKDKKSLQSKYFSLWFKLKRLTKKLVTFKIFDGSFNIMSVQWKTWLLVGRGWSKKKHREDCLKRRLGQLADLIGA